MNGPIYHVTEGPDYQPNGFYKANLVRVGDMNGFFVMENARGETCMVHESKIKLRWMDNTQASRVKDAVGGQS